MKNKIKKIISAGLVASPFFALAATDIDTIIMRVEDIVGLIIPVLIGIALIYFIIGVIKYVTAGADEEKRKEARNTILYGVIGLFAIVAVWGLVRVLADTFSIDTGGTPDIPQFR